MDRKVVEVVFFGLQWSQWSPHPQLLDVVWCSASAVGLGGRLCTSKVGRLCASDVGRLCTLLLCDCGCISVTWFFLFLSFFTSSHNSSLCGFFFTSLCGVFVFRLVFRAFSSFSSRVAPPLTQLHPSCLTQRTQLISHNSSHHTTHTTQDYVQGAVLQMTGDQGAVLLCAEENECFCPPSPCPRLCSRCSASDDRRSRCSAFVRRGKWMLLSPPPLPKTMFKVQCFWWQAIKVQCICVQRNVNAFVSPPPPNQTLNGWVKWWFKSMDPTLVPSINDAFVPPHPPNQSLNGWYPASMCADDRSMCADDPVSLCADDSFAMCADDPLSLCADDPFTCRSCSCSVV